jgi:hypothetical protein
VEVRQVAGGHTALYSKRLAEEMASTVGNIIHDTGQDADVVLSMIEKGLLGSKERYERALFIQGQSTSRDFQTGGADSIFCRYRRTVKSQGSKWIFDIDPSELGRLDAYFYHEDTYGAVLATRTPLLQVKNLGELQDDHEIMFRSGIHPSAIRRVGTDTEYKRTLLLDKLRAKGITEVNGIPIEQFVVVR